MKPRKISLCLLALAMTMAMSTSAFAASPDEPLLSGTEPEVPEICYPTYVAQSDDGTELRKYYDLGPEDDPAGIPRSDFEQDGFHYTMTDLLKQELPEYEERLHTETVSVASKSKDMATVLSVLPEKKEFITEDGFTGTLTLRLESVQVEVSGYGSTTKEISATRSYPNLSDQDTQFIPKTIEQDGKTLTLQNIEWQSDNTATVDGYALTDRYTAVATYTGSKTSSYVKGYTVTAEYSGTVSRIALNKVLADYEKENPTDGYSKRGIYHFSNEGVCSWFDFTKKIAELAGNTACDIEPCHSDEFPSPVKRPAYSVLDKTKIKETFGLKIPYWTDSLRKCMGNMDALKA